MKQKKLHISFDLDVGLMEDNKIEKSLLKDEIKDCIKDRLWQFCAWVRIVNFKINSRQ